MLIGATGTPANDQTLLASAIFGDTGNTAQWLKSEDAAVAVAPWGVPTLDSEQRWAVDSATESWLVFAQLTTQSQLESCFASVGENKIISTG